MPGFGVTGQQDFSGGMFQGPSSERIPGNGSYDVINGLFDQDEGVVYRRGGCAYKSNSFSQQILDLWSGWLAAGQRTVGVGGTAVVGRMYSSTSIKALNDDGSWTTIANLSTAPQARSFTVFGSQLMLPGATLYAGTRKATYSTGTASVTAGSATVTGAGTAWLANVDAGMYLKVGGVVDGIVASVQSDTSLTLTAGWAGSTAAGSAYTLQQTNPVLANIQGAYGSTVSFNHIVAVGSPARLVGSFNGNKIGFSARGDVATYLNTDFHELPGGTDTIGLASIKDAAFVFTTGGVWTISNMAYDLTDAYGNPQQRLDLIDSNLVLWSERGIASWDGALVVPCLDDIHLVTPGGDHGTLSAPIRSLYRSYVLANYVTGTSVVHRGHYFLPILSGRVWVDTLVCDLKSGAWARWDGLSGVSNAYAQQASSVDPTVLIGTGGAGQRLTDLTNCFTPSSANKSEADGTTHQFSVTTRDFQTGTNKSNLVKKARLRFEGTSAAGSPTLALSVASGPVSAAYTALSTTDASTPGPSAGTQTVPFAVNRADRFVRLKIATTDAWDTLKLKGLELFIRSRGRQ